MRSFDDLVAEANQVDIAGWDFSWLDGRATEERPPWAYAKSLAGRLRQAQASLDLQTGGGEVLGEAGAYPRIAVATEAWPPNLALAAARLAPLGVVVVSHNGETPLPFADGSFDLVSSRHPVTTDWAEIGRILAPGGHYFSQQVGPSSMVELSEAFLGPLPDADRWRRPEDARLAAENHGLEVTDLRSVKLRAEFHDIGAIVYLLRKCVWWVPDFSVERYLENLQQLHNRIVRDGPFVAYATRFLIEARKPPRIKPARRLSPPATKSPASDGVPDQVANRSPTIRPIQRSPTPRPAEPAGALRMTSIRRAEMIAPPIVLRLPGCRQVAQAPYRAKGFGLTVAAPNCASTVVAPQRSTGSYVVGSRL